MGTAGIMQARNPLQARLDAKSFVQLTIWIALVLVAFMVARWGVSAMQGGLGRLTGRQSETGSLNPFFGGN